MISTVVLLRNSINHSRKQFNERAATMDCRPHTVSMELHAAESLLKSIEDQDETIKDLRGAFDEQEAIIKELREHIQNISRDGLR